LHGTFETNIEPSRRKFFQVRAYTLLRNIALSQATHPFPIERKPVSAREKSRGIFHQSRIKIL
jgi:hypothetical protein